MASSAGRSASFRLWGGVQRDALLLIALFWTAAFAVSSVRYAMQGALDLGIMAPRLAAIAAFSGLLCWLMVQLLEAAGARNFAERTFWGLCGALAMSVLQSMFHFLSCRVAPIDGLAAMTLEEAALAALISFTYFVGWTGLHLALIYYREGEAERRQQALQGKVDADAGLAAPGELIFWASRGRRLVRVRADDIIWVEAQKDYVELHARSGGGMLRETLASLQEKLDPACFIRVHRSAIVRRSEVAAIRRKSSGALALTLASGSEIPVGRSYAKGLRDLLGRMRDAA